MENLDKVPQEQKSPNIHEQLLAAQKQIGAVGKSASNPFFKTKYADYNSIMEVAKPALNDNGLYVSHTFVFQDDRQYIKTIVTNQLGDSVECTIPVLLKEQNNPQALGSAITYARRYGLSALLAIETEDDDGNEASKGSKKQAVSEPLKESRQPVKATKAQFQTIGSLKKIKGVSDDTLIQLNKGLTADKMTFERAESIISHLNSLPDAIVDKDLVREGTVIPYDDFPTPADLDALFEKQPQVEIAEPEHKKTDTEVPLFD